MFKLYYSVLWIVSTANVINNLLGLWDHDHDQDQTINCCIPITCAPSAGVCAVKYDAGVQTITWLENIFS